MSASRSGRLQKAAALIPLAALSAAWTLNVTGVIQGSAVASETRPGAILPDGTELPAAAIEDPASVSSTALLGEDPENGSEMVRTAATSGIPAAALAAYQRAATVMNSADKGCNLDWQLVAAIGRVESNHGRANGNRLTSDGVSSPGIYGVPLNGDGVARIVDTDGGQYDGDTAFDRAVGPMQFIPSTWSMVGVDADSDGKRNPQDIDDSALATAVYLCSGEADLSTDEGRRQAVYRYNHSEAYVDTVLGIMESYLGGDYTSIPNGTVSSSDTVISADPSYVPLDLGTGQGPKGKAGKVGKGAKGSGSQGAGSASTGSGSVGTGSPATGGGSGGGSVPVTPPAQEPPVEQPGGGTPPPAGGGGNRAVEGAKETVKGVQDTAGTVTKKLGDTVKDPVTEVQDTLTGLTSKEAREQCLAQGLSLLQITKLNSCIAGLLG